MDVTVETAMPDDRPAIVELVSRCHLPTEGLSQHIATAVVARLDGRLVGCAVVESYADGALLRSVAVDPSARGTGLGQRVVGAALDSAARLGARDVFLLTTTAERFFPRFGFTAVERRHVPAGVQQSEEFHGSVCASATAMHVRLAS
jgi:amino-acid N-acetyltransferase